MVGNVNMELREKGFVDVIRMGHWKVRWEENWNFGLTHCRKVVKIWATIMSSWNRAHEPDTFFVGGGDGGCSMSRISNSKSSSSSSSSSQRSTQNSLELFSYLEKNSVVGIETR